VFESRRRLQFKINHLAAVFRFDFFTSDADWCGVEPIDHRPIAARHEMTVHVNRDGDRRVSELIFHVRQALAILNQK
jgi:hypothetical protein